MSNYNMKVSSSPKVSKHVECLRHLQSQHDELEAQFLEERKALEAKYHKLYQPLYTKRYEIVNGLQEVDGVMSAELDSIKEDQATEEKGVPEFWLTAMKTHEVLAEEIKGQDEGALKFIKDIKWSRLQNPEGFELEFYFNPCPYFKNSVLTKTYHIIDESDPILSQAIGSEIEWYPEKCLTTKVVKRKQRMVSKKTKTTMIIKNCESFFTFFNPPQIPENEDDLDDDDNDELQDRLKQDYNLGIIIRDKIIPHAVSWFTGEAIEEDELDGIDYDGNDDDEDDEDEVEDKENDDGDEEDNESDKEVEQEEKRKQGVKKDIRKDYDEDEDEDEDEEEERKWGLKKDDDDDDDDDEAGDEENDDGDEEDNESDKEAEQEEKRKQGVKKDIKKDYDEDEDEEKERKWDLKKDDDDEAEDDEYDDGDEEDNASDKEAEQEEKRKQGVKKDIKEDNDEDRDEEKERKWGLKKDVEDEDEEEEEEKQVWKKSSDGHKKIGGAQIQKGQQRELDHTCTQMTGAA